MEKETEIALRRMQHRGSRKKEWEDCICHRNVHTLECKINHRKNYRHNYTITIQKSRRKEKRAKGICIVPGCNCRGEREIVIHQYCKKHRKKFKYKTKNEEKLSLSK